MRYDRSLIRAILRRAGVAEFPDSVTKRGANTWPSWRIWRQPAIGR